MTSPGDRRTSPGKRQAQVETEKAGDINSGEAPLRLHKFLAHSGLCSRRRAEEYIAAGRVRVDGVVVTTPGSQVDPAGQTVTCDGRLINLVEQKLYFLLNKPPGYVTTAHDPQGRPTVVSLLKDVAARLFPVGRLDLDTEGALLLTNDGALAQKIQHPSHGVNKTYQALVDGYPTAKSVKRLADGILLEGKMTSPAKLRPVARQGRNTLMEITIHEGRKRQVKNMFREIGHPVVHLRRTAYGKLTVSGLGSGQYRQLNSADLKKIFL
ncbi:MAG: pseudouridine synthase [Desulforhopalus sp.]|jgi:23S rRNA pseudouridine2605 synthase|nr:pseudouridine synthase [Desulforhopalus sp.]